MCFCVRKDKTTAAATAKEDTQRHTVFFSSTGAHTINWQEWEPKQPQGSTKCTIKSNYKLYALQNW